MSVDNLHLELDRLADDGGPTAGPYAGDPAAGGQSAFQRIGDELLALVESIRHFTSAEFDLLRVRLRAAALAGLAVVGAGLLMVVVAAAAAVFVLIGLAGGIAALSSSPSWAGFLIAGLLGFAATSLMFLAAARHRRGQLLRQRIEIYAMRRERRRARLRGDIHDRQERAHASR